MNTPVSERTPEKPRPDAKAILLCDQTITDANTGKPSLIGIFDSIGTSQFPCAVSISIFLKMTDAQGEYTFQAIAGGQLPGPVVVGDRLVEFNLVWNMYVQFAEPGQYEFQIYEDGRLVAHKAFTVALVQEG